MNKDEAYATSPSKSIQKKQLSPDKDAVEDELANELSEEKERLDESIKNIRLYDTTNKNIHIQQPQDYNLGRRHMTTQDGIDIPQDRMDRLFMAEHDMSKYPSIISNKKADNYVDKFIPYFKDKEITYWSTNLEKGNLYKTHSLGVNPFAKSNAFTQSLHNTKGASSFYGNTNNSKDAKNIYLNDKDVEFMDKYYNSTQSVIF